MLCPPQAKENTAGDSGKPKTATSSPSVDTSSYLQKESLTTAKEQEEHQGGAKPLAKDLLVEHMDFDREVETPEPVVSAPSSGPSSDLLGEINNQPEEGLGGASLLAQELAREQQLVEEVASFDRTALREVDTQEPASGAELLRQELGHRAVQEEVQSFDTEVLNKVQVEERVVLPGQDDIQQEKDQVELIGGIENFDASSLTPVAVREPLSGADLLKQELGHRAVQEEVQGFQAGGLKKAEVQEKNVLPGQEEILQEREQVQHLASIQDFDQQELQRVRTVEPLSGAELLQRELAQKAVQEELGSFDTGSMKPTVVEERVVLPDPATMWEEKAGRACSMVWSSSHRKAWHTSRPRSPGLVPTWSSRSWPSSP